MQHPTALAVERFAESCANFRVGLDDAQILQCQKQYNVGADQYWLFGMDIASLLPGEWLTGRIMDAFLGLISNDNDLEATTISSIEMQAKLNENEKKQPQKFNLKGQFLLLDRPLVFLPLLVGNNHWMLYVLTKAPGSDKGLISAYNSEPVSRASKNCSNMLRYFMNMWERRRKSGVTWSSKNRMCLRQDNNYDCGTIVAATAAALALGMPPPSHVSGFRNIMASQILAASMGAPSDWQSHVITFVEATLVTSAAPAEVEGIPGFSRCETCGLTFPDDDMRSHQETNHFIIEHLCPW